EGIEGVMLAGPDVVGIAGYRGRHTGARGGDAVHSGIGDGGHLQAIAAGDKGRIGAHASGSKELIVQYAESGRADGDRSHTGGIKDSPDDSTIAGDGDEIDIV